MTREHKFWIILAVFMAVAVIINTIASKIVTIYGLTFSMSAFAYAVTFPCTDVISEIWGKSRARFVVWLGFVGNLLMVSFLWLALVMPCAEFWVEKQSAFEITLGLVPRIVLGSMIAYLLSQFHDIWAFHFWRRITANKALWVRNNLSTLSSQLIDSVAFVLIAFYGVIPNEALGATILGQWIVKALIAILDTPIVYGIVGWVGYSNELKLSEEEFSRIEGK